MPFQATIRSCQITVVPRITPHPGGTRVIYQGKVGAGLVGYGSGLWEAVRFGEPRGEYPCNFEFHATAVPAAGTPAPLPSARPLPIAPLHIGFIQNLLSEEHEAIYARPSGAPIVTPAVFRIIRDSTLVGAGLLDCGTALPPWFAGKREEIRINVQNPRDPQSNHASVSAGDNPSWEIPIEFVTDKYGHGTLKHVSVKNHYRLFAVVADGTRSIIPVAYIDWGTELEFTAAPGLRTPGQAPAGTLSGRFVWADPTWKDAAGQHMITSGRTPNSILLDTLVGP